MAAALSRRTRPIALSVATVSRKRSDRRIALGKAARRLSMSGLFLDASSRPRQTLLRPRDAHRDRPSTTILDRRSAGDVVSRANAVLLTRDRERWLVALFQPRRAQRRRMRACCEWTEPQTLPPTLVPRRAFGGAPVFRRAMQERGLSAPAIPSPACGRRQREAQARRDVGGESDGSTIVIISMENPIWGDRHQPIARALRAPSVAFRVG
jgi:hypothetical protein